MLSKEEIKAKLGQYKEYLVSKYPISSLAIFGSYARNEQSEHSDLDLLVEFHSKIGSDFISLAQDLEQTLGTKIDLVSKNGIKKKYLDKIQADLIYV